MREPLRVLCAAFAALAFARVAPAQLALITIERPFHARVLAGVVVDETGSPIPRVVVEECDASFSPRPVYDPGEKLSPTTMLWNCETDPRHIIASTTTDASGHFSFPNAKKGKVHYLYLNLSGFDPLQVIVKVGRFARSEPQIKMTVAT
jgi:hypothetical protein